MAERNKDGIVIHSKEDFEGMRKAGKLAAEVLDMISKEVEVGVTTNYLNQLCHDMIIAAGAIPAPLDYRGFPKSICTSINNVICHGIPDDKKLKNGDAVNIDVTVIVDGWHGDTSRMFWSGEAPIKAKRLTEVTYNAMMKGIEQVKPGNSTVDVAKAIQDYAESYNYSVVRDYCGHGLGKVFHDKPNLVHYYKKPKIVKKGMVYDSPKPIVFEEGMFFTIEPMINAGTYETKLDQNDGWTVRTKDRQLSCQFEHSMGVIADGVEIFTTSPTGLNCPPY